jgi:hypothetical protein
MAYRAREYVPGVYQPNDGRLSDLMYQRNQIEANRVQQQGLNNALMWRGIGNAASGTLGELAQYKREQPIRREQERQRKEADKLRGLEQFAGAGGLDEEARGKLLKQEGFVERGQAILDKDMERKAHAATYADAETKRIEKQMSDLTFKLDQVREDPNPPEAYGRVRDSIIAQYGDKVKDKLPPVYDKAALDAVVAEIQTSGDVAARNARAQYHAGLLTKKQTDFETNTKNALGMMAPLAPKANTQVEWDRMWANFDARTKDYTAEEKARIEAAIPYPRQFSEQAWKEAVDLERGDKDPTSNTAMALQFYRDRHEGQNPKTPAEQAEYMRILSGLTTSTHVPTRTGAGRNLTTTQRTGIERWKTNAYAQLEKRRVAEGLSDEEMDNAKEEIQRGYLAQLGIDEGQTLQERAAARGQDISGRPLSEQALPGAAARGQGAAPTGGSIWVQLPSGETREFPASDAQYFQRQKEAGKQLTILTKPPGAAAAPAVPAAPAAPAAPPTPEMVGPEIPERAVMRTPDGKREYTITGRENIARNLEQQWTLQATPERQKMRSPRGLETYVTGRDNIAARLKDQWTIVPTK